MKRNLAIFAVTALLLCSLTACGGNKNSGTANDAGGTANSGSGTVNGTGGTTSGVTGSDTGTADNGAMSGVTAGEADGSAARSGYGTQEEPVVRYGNGYGNTNTDKAATPNATLHGSYDNPTGTPAGRAAASARGLTDDARYRLMLDNAHVHDKDGFLLDGENAQHNTFR